MSTLRAPIKGRRPALGERLAQHALMASLFLLALFLIRHLGDGLPARERPTASLAYRRARAYVTFTLNQHMLSGSADVQGVTGDCQPVDGDSAQFRCQGDARPIGIDGRPFPLAWQCLMYYQDQGPPWRCDNLFLRQAGGRPILRASQGQIRR